jgi:hypothetical protein
VRSILRLGPVLSMSSTLLKVYRLIGGKVESVGCDGWNNVTHEIVTIW